MRVLFDLWMSQDIFQKKIDQIYENCRGSVGIVDDTQGFGNEETHDKGLHEAMECTKIADIKLNYDKLLLKPNLIVSLVTCTLQKESSQTQIKKKPSIQCIHPSISISWVHS